MRSLEDITRDLAATTDALLALDRDDFAERYRLLTRRDQLRAEAESYHDDLDATRPSHDVMSELAELRKQRDAELKRHAERVVSSNSGGSRGASGAVDAEKLKLAAKARDAGPLAELNKRIAHLEAILERRVGGT